MIANADIIGNPRNQKSSNFESEEQKNERVKKKERKFWQDMTSVLSDKRKNTWKALE